MPRLAVIGALLTGSCLVLAHDFGYDGIEGPDHWGDSYVSCSGKYQSPINVDEHLVRYVTLPPLRFSGFKANPLSSTLTNNGHTVMLQLNTTEEACVSGGPLNGRYTFAQLHFHWGSNDSIGSEGTINNHSFPLELHMVFHKSEYGNIPEAIKHKDGLAVIGLFYMLHGPANAVYKEIVQDLPKVTNPGTNTRLQTQIPLESLLPDNKHLYFTYNGSLTTPPCSEVVTWIEFKQAILLSDSQVAAFRKLRTDSGFMTHNFRPVQPLSGRLVLFNAGVPDSGVSSLDVHLYALSCSMLLWVMLNR